MGHCHPHEVVSGNSDIAHLDEAVGAVAPEEALDEDQDDILADHGDPYEVRACADLDRHVVLDRPVLETC